MDAGFNTGNVRLQGLHKGWQGRGDGTDPVLGDEGWVPLLAWGTFCAGQGEGWLPRQVTAPEGGWGGGGVGSVVGGRWRGRAGGEAGLWAHVSVALALLWGRGTAGSFACGGRAGGGVGVHWGSGWGCVGLGCCGRGVLGHGWGLCLVVHPGVVGVGGVEGGMGWFAWYASPRGVVAEKRCQN